MEKKTKKVRLLLLERTLKLKQLSVDDDGMGYEEIEVEIQEEVEDEEEEEATNPNTQLRELYTYNFIHNLLLILGFTVIRQRRLMQLLRNSEVGRLFRLTEDDFDDDDDNDGDFNPRWRRTRRHRPDPNRFPKIPSDEGTELMNSGIFGSNEAHTVTSNDRNSIGKKKKLALRILDRELAIESPAKQRLNQRLMAQVGRSEMLL